MIHSSPRLDGMTAAEEEFLRSLRATFKVEADEHLQEIGTGLLELEKTAGTGSSCRSWSPCSGPHTA